MAGDKKALNRPKKRTLVRWDGKFRLSSTFLTAICCCRTHCCHTLTVLDNLNELLLLTVQSVCNTQGVRIPWGDVAGTMGNNVSEGAIVQHLAKLRTRRVASNKQVPPPLRRGGSTSTSKASATSTSPTKVSAETSPRKDHTKAKARKAVDSSDEEEIPLENETSSSDEEYGKRRRSKKSGKKKSRKKRKLNVDSEGESISDKGERNEAEEVEDTDDELLAVGAQFLSYPNDKKCSSGSASPSPDDSTEKESKVVILRYGRRNSMTFQDGRALFIDNEGSKGFKKAATKEAYHPGQDLNGNDHNYPGIPGFRPPRPGGGRKYDETDYTLPIPKRGENPMRPYLMAGNWPKDAVLKLYDRDDPRIPGVPPIPPTVIPAAWLRDENCDPALRFNRVLDYDREKNYPECREREKQRPDYKEYVDHHGELPFFFEPDWNLPPTLHMTDANDDYKVLNYLAKDAVDPEPLRQNHSNFNALNLRLVQMDKEIDRGNMVDMNRLEDIHRELDYQGELPPGKCYNLMGELEDKDVARGYEEWLT